jgi:hypothetical protein
MRGTWSTRTILIKLSEIVERAANWELWKFQLLMIAQSWVISDLLFDFVHILGALSEAGG